MWIAIVIIGIMIVIMFATLWWAAKQDGDVDEQHETYSSSRDGVHPKDDDWRDITIHDR